MDETIWSYLPEELHMTIMGFLPAESLLRFRVVSKKWNEFLLEQRFHNVRVSICRDFIERMQRYPMPRRFKVECSNNRFLLAVRFGEDIYVMNTSKVSVRKLPRVRRSSNYRWDVMGMVANESTEDYGVFVGSEVLPTGQILKVRQYKSVTGSWSSCGNIKLSHPTGRLVGLAVHGQDCLALSQCNLGFLTSSTIRLYEVLRSDESRTWKRFPGDICYCREIAPLFFDRTGRLQILGFSASKCSLWEYGDSTKEWSLVHSFAISWFDHEEVESIEYLLGEDFVSYAQVYGHCVYFGTVSETKPNFCRRSKYNLSTEQFEQMSLDENEGMPVKKLLTGVGFFLKSV